MMALILCDHSDNIYKDGSDTEILRKNNCENSKAISQREDTPKNSVSVFVHIRHSSMSAYSLGES